MRTVNCWVGAVWPCSTSLKSRVEGVMVSTPGMTPCPVSVAFCDPPAVALTVSVPLKPVTLLGEKTMEKSQADARAERRGARRACGQREPGA